VTETELERIRSAYQARDTASETPYRWDNPGYVTYMQSVERAVLRAFGKSSVSLAGARVLDVGCGSGYFLHRLHEYGAGECHGIDLMENRVMEGRKRYPTLELRVGSATELPYADGTFDVVTQFTCLSSILDEDVRLAVAREMQRVATGGWVLSFDMRGLWLGRLVRRRSSVDALTHTVALDRPELIRLFGVPAVLRRETLTIGIAELTGRHHLIGVTLGTMPFLRSHLLGLWRCPSGTVGGSAAHGSSCVSRTAPSCLRD
jgi:SAM-dependent methyltransferase